MTTKMETTAGTVRPRGGLRRRADLAYGYLAAVFVLGVLVQVFLAGVGVFGINAPKVADASSLDPHRMWGSVLMVLAIVLLILALVARPSVSTVLSTLLLAVLVTVAQSGLAAAGDSNKWLGGAHALDGMIILLLSLWLAFAARHRRSRSKNLDNPA